MIYLILIAALLVPSLAHAQSFGKQTYAASTATKTVTITTNPTTNPLFAICGSSTKTIRVRQIIFDYTMESTAIHADPILTKTSTAITTGTGTAVALTQVPLDSNYAAGTASQVNVYTVPPTTGAAVGVVSIQMKIAAPTGAPPTFGSTLAAPFLFRSTNEGESIVLRGTAQCVQGSFGTSPGAQHVRYTVSILWTEE